MNMPPSELGYRAEVPRAVVLLVDDDENILQFVAMALRHAGFEVVTATCPSEAMEQNGRRRFDAVLLDYGLPEATGVELLQQIRKVHPQMPAVLSSGRVSAELKAAARSLGVATMEKPYRIGALIRALEDALPARS